MATNRKAVSARMTDLFDDQMLMDSGDLIAGVDEAGRGPLAGAVYAAAVILDPNEPIEGLRDILRQAGCELVGAGVCVEKGFQPGGKKLREEGVKVVSLAIVDAIEDGNIRLRDD